MEVTLRGLSSVQAEIRAIEAELRLASMRKDLLAKSCNVETVNRAWSVQNHIRRYEDDKRF